MNQQTVMSESSQFRFQRGQALIIIAAAMVAILAVTGLSIDGGRWFFAHRDAKNAVDAAVIYAAYKKCELGISPLYNDVVIQAAYSAAAENGYLNDTVTVETPPLSDPAAGDIRFVRVNINDSIDPLLIQLVYPHPLPVNVSATAQCFPGGIWTGITGPLLALGQCSPEHPSLSSMGGVNEIVGGSYSNGYFKIGGKHEAQHFHGPVGAADDLILAGPGGVAYSEPPEANTDVLLPNPLDWVTYDSFCDPDGYYYRAGQTFDLSTGGPVNAQRLRKEGLLGKDKNPAPGELQLGELASGVYCAGKNDIKLTGSEFHGTVTFVTHGYINMQANMNFQPFEEGLLMFTDRESPCGADDSIHLAGTGSEPPEVYHTASGEVPPDPDVVIDTSSYDGGLSLVPSNSIFAGLIYAPNGHITLAGAKATIMGALIANSISADNGSDHVIWYYDEFVRQITPHYAVND